jgi:NifU-like protein involved in Fe-S cluster formation
MSDQDLLRLYSARLLDLAASIPHAAPLRDPEGWARRRSPTCGSSVAVGVRMADGRVAAFGQEVRACALGQASASVLGHAVLGRTEEELRAARDGLRAMLKEGGPAPAAPFDGFEALSVARDYPNRHASILLSVEATLEAVEEAKKKAAAPGGVGGQ